MFRPLYFHQWQFCAFMLKTTITCLSETSFLISFSNYQSRPHSLTNMQSSGSQFSELKRRFKYYTWRIEKALGMANVRSAISKNVFYCWIHMRKEGTARPDAGTSWCQKTATQPWSCWETDGMNGPVRSHTGASEATPTAIVSCSYDN